MYLGKRDSDQTLDMLYVVYTPYMNRVSIKECDLYLDSTVYIVLLYREAL